MPALPDACEAQVPPPPAVAACPLCRDACEAQVPPPPAVAAWPLCRDACGRRFSHRRRCNFLLDFLTDALSRLGDHVDDRESSPLDAFLGLTGNAQTTGASGNRRLPPGNLRPCPAYGLKRRSPHKTRRGCRLRRKSVLHHPDRSLPNVAPSQRCGQSQPRRHLLLLTRPTLGGWHHASITCRTCLNE
ncbi:hypothetical protein I553_5915 [Mycobacterium xenopi 4042]|uniref:Uncharacterized protein n=1 Tax=Mycobacterium xenopi 4042 TaxID=1299334 RepID=X8BEY6_MYCXE|nr:hypothetical protein I553_5915 [Mycobacterium xenopi 4042]